MLTLLLFFSIALSLLAGRSIDSHAICLVRASGDLVTGKPGLAVGLLVTVACAAGVFYSITALQLRPQPPAWANPTLLTTLGATLFAWGAVINGACTVGTLGRLARGEIGFVATLGAGLAVSLLMPRTMPPVRPMDLPVLNSWGWPAIIIGSAVLAVLAVRGNLGGSRGLRTYILLGVAAALITNWQGDWTWLRLAQQVQHREEISLGAVACLAAVVVGAFTTALASGRWRLIPPHLPTMAREALGGGMMAAGALLVPGGNDSLLAYGFPSGSPHAILAFVMIVGWLLLIMWKLPTVRTWRFWPELSGAVRTRGAMAWAPAEDSRP
jgi:uncharacterized protein